MSWSSPWSTKVRLVVMALVTLSHVTSTASAQAETTRATEATSATDAEARGLFEAGRAAFADGRFEDARDYFARRNSAGTTSWI